MVARRRRGVARLGCLVFLLLFAVAGYASIVVGAVHLRAYRFRDSMSQQLRFADRATDAQIIRRLQARADSLGLPVTAHDIRVERSPRTISISAEYGETVDLHLVRRELRFAPRVERTW